MTRFLGIALVLCAGAIPVFNSHAAANDFECPAQSAARLGKLTDRRVWTEQETRFAMTAQSGCAPRLGGLTDFKNVSLTIQNGALRVLKVEARFATLDPVSGELLLGDVTGPVETGCVGHDRLIVLNLKSGQLQRPGHTPLNFFSKESVGGCSVKLASK